jgi:predicted N-acetyltransferase YhbS
MITIRRERAADAAAREALLDEAYGPIRFTKTSEKLRAGRLPAAGLAFVAVEGGRLVGTLRLWSAAAGMGRDSLLLGPLAVAPSHRNRGIGSALMRRALRDARRRGHKSVLLVGDAPYYGRFGFSAEKTAKLWMPGPYEPHRLLGCELVPGALDGARGLIRVPQAPATAPAGLVPALAGSQRPRAA